MPDARASSRVVVIWIDWYPYHVSRFRGLAAAHELADEVTGIELVGGIGVHAGLKFREDLPADLQVETLMPLNSWREVNKLALAVRLWRKLSKLHPTVVLVPGYYTTAGIASALWARLHGATSVLMTESTAFDHARTGWKEWMKGWLLRELFEWAVTGGKAHVQYLHQLGFPADRIAGCYDVVDNDFFRNGTDALRSKSAETSSAGRACPCPSPYFLYVGRLAEEKNVRALLQSWIAYRDKGGTWPLVLVGDGPEASMLRELTASSFYATDVYFPGLKSSAELLPFYAFAGAFALPSIREPWGLVVNEAMAAGLPVLVSERCGCAADLVLDGRNGYTFDPTDQAALADSLRMMETMPVEDRLAMGLASRDIISTYSPLAFGRSVASIANSAGQSGRASLGEPAAVEPIPGGSQ